jgi:hypothetical protein
MAPVHEVGDHPNGSTDRLLGELIAEVRTVKHNLKTDSQKLDIVAGKVDALAIVVANQGHLQEDVDELKSVVKDQRGTIDLLLADKHRREGAIGLVEWLARHWPFTILGSIIVGVVLWANGRLHV